MKSWPVKLQTASVILALAAAMASAFSAWSSWQSAYTAKASLQANLLERLEARWSSGRMIAVRRSLAKEIQTKEPHEAGELLTKQVLDYFDLLSYAKVIRI